MKNFLILVVFLIAFISEACISPARMEGQSMLPTIKNGDRIFIDSSGGAIRRGDILMFRYPKDETKFFLKRAIGLPGDKIEIRGTKVFINEEILEEPYLDPKLNTLESVRPPVIVADDNYFVMGDNRDNSSDSRVWGTVDKKLIAGKFRMTYYSTEK